MGGLQEEGFGTSLVRGVVCDRLPILNDVLNEDSHPKKEYTPGVLVVIKSKKVLLQRKDE